MSSLGENNGEPFLMVAYVLMMPDIFDFSFGSLGNLSTFHLLASLFVTSQFGKHQKLITPSRHCIRQILLKKKIVKVNIIEHLESIENIKFSKVEPCLIGKVKQKPQNITITQYPH